MNWSIIRSFNGDVKRLLAAMGLMSFAYFGVSGVLFNLYLVRLGYDIEFIGLLYAVGQVLWGAVSLPAGAIGRRIGLKPAIIIGFATPAVGFALLLSTEWLPSALWTPWIVGAWLMCWIASALFTVCSVPYLMLAAGPSGKNHAFSALAGMSALMGLSGGVLAGALPALIVGMTGWSLDDPAPYRVTLWLVPIAYATGALLFAGAAPLRLPVDNAGTVRGRAPVPFLVFLGAIMALQSATAGGSRAFLNVFLDLGLSVPAPQIGAIMGTAQVLPIFAAFVTPLLLERLGAARTLSVCGLALAVAATLLGLSGHWILAGVAFAGTTAFGGISNAALNVLSQEHVAATWRSISAATLNIGLAIGLATATGVGGYLIQALGFRSFFLMLALAAFTSAPLLLAFVRRQRAAPVTGTDI